MMNHRPVTLVKYASPSPHLQPQFQPQFQPLLASDEMLMPKDPHASKSGVCGLWKDFVEEKTCFPEIL